MSIGMMTQGPGMYRGSFGDSGLLSVNESNPDAVQADKRGGFARFFEVAVKNEAKSITADTPIYDKEIHVDIYSPADPQNIPCRRVRTAAGVLVGKEWTLEFPKEWAQFQSGEEQVPDGTPLSQWPACDVALKATLNAMHIFTVEQLGAATDATIMRIPMGGRELQAKARAMLLAAKNTGEAQRQAAIAARAMEDRNEMESKMADLQRQLDLIIKSGKIVAGAGVADPVPVPIAQEDPIVQAAMMSGAVPISQSDMSAMTPRRGRPPGSRNQA